MENTKDESLARRLLGKIPDLIVLSLLWTLCSLPVFTLGASCTALYDCVLHTIREGDDEPAWKRFFRVFKREFPLATFMTVLFLLFFFALFLIDILFAAVVSEYPDSRALPILHIVYRALMLLPACACCWLFPLLDRFKFNKKMLRVTAWKLTFQEMAPTAVMVFIVVLAGIVTLRLYGIPLILLPGLVCLVLSLIMERIFAKYEVTEPLVTDPEPASDGAEQSEETEKTEKTE